MGDLKGSRANAAAAIHTPANFPTWGHLATVVRLHQEGQAKESLAYTKADHRAAYKQLPVCEGHKKLAVVP